jgi:hypothetical protein
VAGFCAAQWPDFIPPLTNDALSGNKTLVMIAQRLSTLRSCDHIPLLRQAEIVGIWEALECDYSEFRYIAQGSDRKRDS